MMGLAACGDPVSGRARTSAGPQQALMAGVALGTGVATPRVSEILPDGPWRHASLPAYYWASNRELQVRFERARQAL